MQIYIYVRYLIFYVLLLLFLGCSSLGHKANSKNLNTLGSKQMKIAPYLKNWNDGERDWSYVKDPTSEIENWEKKSNISLPDDYRRFLIAYNGGSPYPRLFKHGMGSLTAGPYEDQSNETYVDIILSWESVESHWRGETYGKGIPPGYLLIAVTPGAIQVLMNIDSEKGQIVSWYHSTSPWGSGNNTEIYPIANSFTEFLGILYGNKEDFDAWHLDYEDLAKDLKL